MMSFSQTALLLGIYCVVTVCDIGVKEEHHHRIHVLTHTALYTKRVVCDVMIRCGLVYACVLLKSCLVEWIAKGAPKYIGT